MWTTIKQLLNFLNLRYDADISGLPAPQWETKTRTRTRTTTPDPDNVVRDKADNTPRTREVTEDSITWTLWKGQEDRSSQITDADQRTVEDRGLDLTKYGIIKVAWASKDNKGGYLSARQASRQLSRDLGRGYGLRTVETYFAAINEANPSPSIAAAN